MIWCLAGASSTSEPAAAVDAAFERLLGILGRSKSALALARSSGECSGNNVVPAIDEWAAASACTEPGRLAGVEPGAAALASADPCRGLNGGRDVGHGSLTCVSRPYTGQSRGWRALPGAAAVLGTKIREPARPVLSALLLWSIRLPSPAEVRKKRAPQQTRSRSRRTHQPHPARRDGQQQQWTARFHRVCV